MAQSLNTTSNHNDLLNDIIKPDMLATERPDLFTKTQVAWYLRHRQRNGLEKTGAVIKVGKRLFIHRKKFTNWFLSQAN